jgi:hypothetical protein
LIENQGQQTIYSGHCLSVGGQQTAREGKYGEKRSVLYDFEVTDGC